MKVHYYIQANGIFQWKMSSNNKTNGALVALCLAVGIIRLVSVIITFKIDTMENSLQPLRSVTIWLSFCLKNFSFHLLL